MIRYCIGCRAELHACMGFQLARDTLANIEGTQQHIRELCWKCAYRCEVDPDLLEQLAT